MAGCVRGHPCGLHGGQAMFLNPHRFKQKKKTIKSIRVSGYKETKKRRKAKSKERVRKDLRAVKRKGKGKSEGQGK